MENSLLLQLELTSYKLETLAICDWNERLALYQLPGKQHGKDRYLGFIPTCLNWIGNSSEYIAIGGHNNKLNLYSYEGCQIGSLCEESSWILSCAKHPKDQRLLIGCQDGVIRSIDFFLPVVHSFFHDRYSFREILTDVVIQHIITEQRARIKCRDVVKKIAIYKNRLAIQLSDRVLIYESAADDIFDMHYRIKDKVLVNCDCFMLVLTSQYIVCCQDCQIRCVSAQGITDHEWRTESPVHCICQIGGSCACESLIVGLADGQILKLTLGNTFPLPLLKVNSKISSIDVSADRDKVAIIDDSGTLTIYSLVTKDAYMRESNALSFAWNQIINDLLCYCTKDTLYIVVDDCVCHQQPIEGSVISFNGSSVFYLSGQIVKSMNIQMAQAMYHYLNADHLQDAYRIACLGVTESEWRDLGVAAILKMELQIARSACIQLGDYPLLAYIQQLDDRRRRSAIQQPSTSLNSAESFIIEAELACFQGDFSKAVKAFKKADRLDRVVSLYTDLRRFAEAKEVMTSAEGDSVADLNKHRSWDSTRSLLMKHAEWARTTKDHRAAAGMFIEAGDFAAATELASENKWVDVLLEISRKVDGGDRNNLNLCAKSLAELGEYAFAAECYARMGDVSSQLDILIKAGKWDESLSLLQEHPEYSKKVYLPYAQYLAENDSFEEAQAAFEKAGLAEEAVKFLEELASCAVFESKFEDASWFYWKLSKQYAEIAKKSVGKNFVKPNSTFSECDHLIRFRVLFSDRREKRNSLQRFMTFSKLADLYYVYSNIHQYMNDSFALHMPETYLNMARYLLQRIDKDEIEKISKVNILYTLAKHSRALKAFKLARFAFDRLQNMRISEPLRTMVELQSLAIRATPLSDSEDVNIHCYRCSSSYSILQNDNRCINCRAPFIFSFLSFEVLPLVEFIPDPELSAEQITEYIQCETDTYKKFHSRGRPDYNDAALNTERDAFGERLVNFNWSTDQYEPISLDAEALKAIPSSEIIILEEDYPLRKRYFKNVVPEIAITSCQFCHKFFQKEDYQVVFLQKRQCPFCRKSKLTINAAQKKAKLTLRAHYYPIEPILTKINRRYCVGFLCRESLCFGENHLNIFIVATYADGKAPDDVIGFDKWLRERQERFTGLNYLVFGLGDSSYIEFNEFAKQVDRRFFNLGGIRKMSVCLGDGAHNIEADFHSWQTSLCQLYNLTECKLNALPSLKQDYEFTHPSLSEVKSLGGAFTGEPERLHSYRFNAPSFSPANPFLAPVTLNSELYNCLDRSCRLIELDLSKSGIKYAAGDHLAVLPRNSEKLALKLCDLLQVDPQDYIYIKSISGSSEKQPSRFPTPCTYLTAFTHYLDIMFPIRFDLIEALIGFTASERDRALLQHLIAPQIEGNDENSYERWILASRRGIVEVLEDLPSCRPSADVVCRLLPRLQPRFYSVASSPRYQPNRLRLIVKIVEYKSLTGRLHEGIASSYLSRLAPGDTVPVYLRRSDFRLPRSPLTPIIMVGAGTGLAPFLGFLQERTFVKLKGGRLGEAMLFYGCRNRNQDCILPDELNEAFNNGVISHLQIAYSRDQEHKIYVQHLMRDLSETIWNFLKSGGGYLYICGDSKNMARDVKQALLEIFQQQGTLTSSEAEEYFQELKSINRCLFDAWS
ncbi:hypothetical protein Aperf_G00000023570 [Anoplocephala perfoliata]